MIKYFKKILSLAPKGSKSVESTIIDMCNLPRRIMTDDISPLSVYANSGYSSNNEKITQEDVRTYLELNPHLIYDWGLFSANQRCSPAWGFQKLGTDIYRVFYLNDNPKLCTEQFYKNGTAACALFIRMEFEMFRGFAEAEIKRE